MVGWHEENNLLICTMEGSLEVPIELFVTCISFDLAISLLRIQPTEEDKNRDENVHYKILFNSKNLETP